jgi:hypothetical protein
MRVTDGTALCSRLDAVDRYSDWQKYLALSTGLPLAFWSQPIEEELLANTAACAEAQNFSAMVASRLFNSGRQHRQGRAKNSYKVTYDQNLLIIAINDIRNINFPKRD